MKNSTGEIDQMDVEAVFRPGIDTHFSPTAFDNLKMGGISRKPSSAQRKNDKNSTATKAVSERPTGTAALLKSWPFGTRVEIVPDFYY